MSNYSKTTNFGTKDTLPTGDSQKIIRGSEFDTEFDNIATAITSKLDSPASSANVNFLQSGAAAVSRTVQSKLRDVVSVKDFGAVGDGVADDTAAIQAAVNACQAGGGVYIPEGRYKISDAILLPRPITVCGAGMGNVYADYTASSYDTFSAIQQTNTAKPAFKMVASQENYAFNEYGILNVHFQNLMISGPSSSSYALSGVCADTTVNGGDFHIRHCHMNNVAIRYFTTGVDYTGIAYLNTFNNSLVYNCTTGWKVARGLSGDNGGQTRWFGCTGVACGTVASLNENGSAGSFAFFGCTLSESQYGIRSDEECVITVSGCEFESLTNSGNGAGIYINIAEANPNSSAAKTIVGNKFLSNDADIWIDKTTSAFSGGGFAWPMLIDSNTLVSSTALKITVPAGHVGIDSKLFVFGAANAGPNGPVSSGQISANFLGYDARTWAAKSAPTGTVVGTSDTQTISGKTFNQNSLQLVGTAFQNVTYSLNSAAGTTGNFVRLQFSDNNGSGDIGSLTGYGSAYGGVFNNNLVLATQGSNRVFITSSSARPATDNAYALGDASYRWSVVYAGTGTINTSDEREKQDISALDDAEKRVAVAIKGLVKKFRFKDAVQKKGNDARIHVGVIVQDVMAAFQAEGLDPMRYGIVCYDQWEETPAVLSDDGTVISQAVPAGDRYGVRYEELLAFIISAL